MPTKISIGIILCRKKSPVDSLEVLLVHKRCTYAFSEFVLGKYPRNHAKSKALISIFSRMTIEELLDIWSLNFDQLWYHLWLSNDHGSSYEKKKAKFIALICDDDGKYLRKTLLSVPTCGTLLWEVPKGHRRRGGQKETDLECAIRELNEETGVCKSEYKILPGVKKRVNYISAGTHYICTYYVAISTIRKYDIPPLIFNREIRHMAEISEVCWFNIGQVRCLLDSKRLVSLIEPTFRCAKKFIKGRQYQKRQNPTLALAQPNTCTK
jgi:8-oxo-dGTP pyrophosphatase MutT (NUDIX family)